MRNNLFILVAAFSLSSTSQAIFAAELGRLPVGETGNVLKFESATAEKIPWGQVFQMRLVLVDAKDKAVDFKCSKVDARMPEHNHGMILRPVVKKVSAGTYEVSGMKLHMPGFWEILVEVELASKKYQLVLPYRL